MARLQPSLSALLLAVTCLTPLTMSSEASALLPPDNLDIADPAPTGGASNIGGATGSGGSAGVAAPPLTVYLDRYTYYVGEVITGQVDCPSCVPDGPTFFDASGMQINGAVVYDESSYGHFVFIPDMPLAVGDYIAQFDYAGTSFEVIDGAPQLPTYAATLIESPQPAGQPIHCQSYVPGYESYEAYPQTRIDAALTVSLAGESTDQYSYEFSIDGAARTTSLAGNPDAIFRQGSEEFCVEVFAIPYTDAAEISLGTTCLDPDVELELGLRETVYGSLDNVLRACELPPDGYVDDWCAVHAEAFERHSCQGFIEDACMQARYECPAGDLPEWFDENGIDPNDPNAPYNPNDPNYGTGGVGNGGSGTGASSSGATANGATGGDDGVGAESGTEDDSGASSDPGGCSCSTGTSRNVGPSGSASLMAGLAGLFVALRRRQRKFVR